MHGSTASRPSETESLLRIAETVAQRATCSRLQVGAVLARDSLILSTGRNGAPMGEAHCVHEVDEPCAISVHAEVNALIFAARNGSATGNATLYLTHAPCFSCAGLIINAGITTIVFRNYFRSTAGLDRLAALGIDRKYLPNGYSMGTDRGACL